MELSNEQTENVEQENLESKPSIEPEPTPQPIEVPSTDNSEAGEVDKPEVVNPVQDPNNSGNLQDRLHNPVNSQPMRIAKRGIVRRG